MRRLVIRLDDALHRRLRFMSLETSESLQRLVVRLLEAELARYDTRKGRRRR